MAATAGTMTCVGLNSGRTYLVDLYIPDATATLITFNPAGLAASTSPSTWRAPEDIMITDISDSGAPTAVGMVLQVNGAPVNGGALRHANLVYSSPNRPKLALPIRGGDFVSALQF